jgi:hypothetical protein
MLNKHSNERNNSYFLETMKNEINMVWAVAKGMHNLTSS